MGEDKKMEELSAIKAVGADVVERRDEDWDEEIPIPPTANFCTIHAAKLLKGLVSGKVTFQAAMGGARIVDAIAKVHSNKLRAAMYQSSPLHKDLLKELSVKIP